MEIMNLTYQKTKKQIKERLDFFSNIKEKGSDYELFEELVFCLLTPQSKSIMAGKAVEILKKKNLIFNGNAQEISDHLNIVRFKNNKAKYIVEARQFFQENEKLDVRRKLENFKDVYELRNWLVKNIKGIGYKEASHYIRNTGFSFDLAILDRHILKNMMALQVIKEIPENIRPKKYFWLEEKLQEFSKKINIPMGYLDFIWFYQETGQIYK